MIISLLKNCADCNTFTYYNRLSETYFLINILKKPIYKQVCIIIQTAATFSNLIPFILITVYKFETIIQSSCKRDLMRSILFKSNQRLKFSNTLSMIHVLNIFIIYQTTHFFLDKCKPLSTTFCKGILYKKKITFKCSP